MAQVRLELAAERRLREAAEKALEAERAARAEAEEAASRAASDARNAPALGRSVREERKEASVLESEAQREREKSRVLRVRIQSLQAEKQALAEERDRALSEAAELRKQSRAVRNKKGVGLGRRESKADSLVTIDPTSAELPSRRTASRRGVAALENAVNERSAGWEPFNLEPADVVPNLEEVNLGDLEVHKDGVEMTTDLDGRTVLSPVHRALQKPTDMKGDVSFSRLDGEENKAADVARTERRLVQDRPVITSRPTLPGTSASPSRPDTLAGVSPPRRGRR